MSAYNGNVQLVTIGLAAGIRMLAIAFFLVWCIWSFLTLYHDKEIAWQTGGLRSYRLNLNSAHTCVGKPPSVIVHYFPIYGACFKNLRLPVRQRGCFHHELYHVCDLQ